MLYFTLFLIASFTLAYTFGSLPFSVLVSRAFGLPDPRGYGSGNTGATNVARSGNKTAALLTLVLDMGKGALAVALVYLAAPAIVDSLNMNESQIQMGAAVAGAASVCGHIFSIFLRGRGGRGVATAFGVYMAWDIVPAAGVAAVWLFVFALARYSSLASLSAAAAAVLLFIIYAATPIAMASAVIGGLIIFRHKDNIIRLLKGEERAFKSPPQK